jgi:RNA polymerase primary sigma factor
VDPVAAYLAEICRQEPPTAAEERRLFAEGQRDELVTRNTRLVASIAGRYRDMGVPFRDLVQEGIVGLIEAVDGFDPERGRLSTYAVPKIRRAIVNALKTDRAMTVPRNAVDDIGSLARSAAKLEQELGREPTLGELAEDAGFGTAHATNLLRAEAVAPLESDDGSLLNLVGDDGVERQALAAVVASRLDEMEAGRTRTVVRRRWLGGETQQAIADDYGLTRQRISQIEHDGLDALRKKLGVADG